MRTSSWSERIRVVALALALVSPLGAPAAEPLERNSDDPESVDILKSLLPLYAQLSRAGRFSLGQVSVGWVEGRPNPDLATDDVCGCHYLPSGRVINPDQCSPIGATGSEDLARVGLIRIVGFDRLRRAVIPGEGSEQSRLNALSRAERFRVENQLRVMLKDPHLAILAPLPVADRVRHLEIGKVAETAPTWPHCAIRVNDRSFSPPPQLNGFVARAMLYAAARYGVSVEFPLGQLKRVSDQYPPSQWEIERDALLSKFYRTYGSNPYLIAAVKASPRTTR